MQSSTHLFSILHKPNVYITFHKIQQIKTLTQSHTIIAIYEKLSEMQRKYEATTNGPNWEE